jgi:hypothetical protein
MEERMPDRAEQEIAGRLARERPVPRAGFRAELRSRLLVSARRWESAPPRLRRLIYVYAGSGAAMLAAVAAGVIGAGPLAA